MAGLGRGLQVCTLRTLIYVILCITCLVVGDESHFKNFGLFTSGSVAANIDSLRVCAINKLPELFIIAK